MRKLLLVVVALCGFMPLVRAQHVAVKTNALCWGVLAPNLGVEFGAGRRVTVELFGAYRPWTVWKNPDARFWLAQPEVRYWLCESFEGHFFGLHLHGAQYYAHAGASIYDGYLAGAGLSYGYAWILSPHWNLEAQVGVGYARLWYKERPNLPCEKCFTDRTGNYVGPTRLSLTFSYLF